MKVKLIEDRLPIPRGYTLGKEYLVFDESDTRFLLFTMKGILDLLVSHLEACTGIGRKFNED